VLIWGILQDVNVTRTFQRFLRRSTARCSFVHGLAIVSGKGGLEEMVLNAGNRKRIKRVGLTWRLRRCLRVKIQDIKERFGGGGSKSSKREHGERRGND
jgi:hypothetical protein